jgi:hypothetical protein
MEARHQNAADARFAHPVNALRGIGPAEARGLEVVLEVRSRSPLQVAHEREHTGRVR